MTPFSLPKTAKNRWGCDPCAGCGVQCADCARAYLVCQEEKQRFASKEEVLEARRGRAPEFGWLGGFPICPTCKPQLEAGGVYVTEQP